MSTDARAEDFVRVMLTKSEDATGILAVLRNGPDPVTIVDRGTYWLVEGHGEINVDVDDVGDRVGREVSVEDILVAFTSYAGRIDVDDTAVRVTAEFLQMPAGAGEGAA
jgi:hypothetical protein